MSLYFTSWNRVILMTFKISRARQWYKIWIISLADISSLKYLAPGTQEWKQSMKYIKFLNFNHIWFFSIICFICLADGVSVGEISTDTNKLKKKKKRSKPNSIGGSSCSYDVPGPLDAGGLRWEREDRDNIEKEREGEEVRKEERGCWNEKARGVIWGI